MQNPTQVKNKIKIKVYKYTDTVIPKLHDKSLRHGYTVSSCSYSQLGSPKGATPASLIQFAPSLVLFVIPRLLLPFTVKLFTVLTCAPNVFLFRCPNHYDLFLRIFTGNEATRSSFYLCIQCKSTLFPYYAQPCSNGANILSILTK